VRHAGETRATKRPAAIHQRAATMRQEAEESGRAKYNLATLRCHRKS
jgi:hypothetical protein